MILLDAEQGMCEQIMIAWGPLITMYSFPASTRCSSKAVKLMYSIKAATKFAEVQKSALGLEVPYNCRTEK